MGDSSGADGPPPLVSSSSSEEGGLLETPTEGGAKPCVRPRWLARDAHSRICNMNCEIPNYPQWCAEIQLVSGDDHRCAVHRDMSVTMRRARMQIVLPD